MYAIRKLKFENGTPKTDRVVMVTRRFETAKRLVEAMSLEDLQPLLTGWAATFNDTEHGFEAYYVYEPRQLKDLIRGVV